MIYVQVFPTTAATATSRSPKIISNVMLGLLLEEEEEEEVDEEE